MIVIEVLDCGFKRIILKKINSCRNNADAEFILQERNKILFYTYWRNLSFTYPSLHKSLESVKSYLIWKYNRDLHEDKSSYKLALEMINNKNK